MKQIFVILFAALLAGCDAWDFTTQISDAKQDLKVCQDDKLKLGNRVTDLTSQVAGLNAVTPGGQAVTEARKALTIRESELDAREKRVIANEESIRLSEIETNELKKEFYKNNGVKLESIGEARQIKKEYEQMRADRDSAENKANNWLKFLYFTLFALFGSVVFMIINFMKYKNEEHRINSAVSILSTTNLEDSSRRLIVEQLGRKIEDKRDDKD